MPELPEVETIKRFLAKNIIGKKIAKVEVLSKKQFPNSSQLIIGRQIVGAQRIGKQLAINLDNDYCLLIHLKLTGQLVFKDKLNPDKKAVFGHPIPFAGGNTLPGKTTRVIIYFKDKNNQNDGAIFFNDLRKFGWIKIVKNSEFKIKSLNDLGIEPLDKGFTPKVLEEIFRKTKRRIKLVLMDQKKIAGLGNIYTNEALFRAGILPTRPANSLTEIEIEKLYRAIKLVLKEAIKAGGSSINDEAYIKPNGLPGRYQNKRLVYQKANQPCPRCQTKIKRINLAGRGTFFCPKCQK
jgi:formamidopyrimidine-DNA glycosylase